MLFNKGGGGSFLSVETSRLLLLLITCKFVIIYCTGMRVSEVTEPSYLFCTILGKDWDLWVWLGGQLIWLCTWQPGTIYTLCWTTPIKLRTILNSHNKFPHQYKLQHYCIGTLNHYHLYLSKSALTGVWMKKCLEQFWPRLRYWEEFARVS